jgi:hypothetical protein
MIPTIPLINRAFFGDKLAAKEVKIKDSVTQVAVILHVGFRVS